MSVTKDVAQWALFEITPSRGDVVAMFGNDWSWNCIHGRGCRTVKAYDGHHSSIFLNFLRDSTLMVSPNSSWMSLHDGWKEQHGEGVHFKREICLIAAISRSEGTPLPQPILRHAIFFMFIKHNWLPFLAPWLVTVSGVLLILGYDKTPQTGLRVRCAPIWINVAFARSYCKEREANNRTQGRQMPLVLVRVNLQKTSLRDQEFNNVMYGHKFLLCNLGTRLPMRWVRKQNW